MKIFFGTYLNNYLKVWLKVIIENKENETKLEDQEVK